MLVRLPLEWPLACVLPEHALRRLALSAARRWRVERMARLLPRAAALVGSRTLAAPLAECMEALQCNFVLREFMTLRCWRPGGWRPDLRLEGRDHLDRALVRGQGAILWSGPFVFTGLMSKIALHQAGVAVSHLSRYRHGFSPTRLGGRILNPLVTKVEARFLAERLVIGRRSWAGELRQLKRRLAENRVVSITISRLGERTVDVPFLNGQLRLATGAPTLARRTGASLLPMLTVAERPGRYVTIIEEPLEAPQELDERTAITRLTEQYAQRLEPHVLCWPDQFWWGFQAIIPPPLQPQLSAQGRRGP